MDEIGATRKDVRLQRHAELPAIVDDAYVPMRNASGAEVQPEPLVELAALQRRIAHFLERVAAAQRQAAAAGAALRLKHHAIVAGAIQFVSGAESSYAGAENDDSLPLAGIRGQREARCHRRRRPQKVPHREGFGDGARTPQSGHCAQQFAPSGCHRSIPQSSAMDRYPPTTSQRNPQAEAVFVGVEPVRLS